MKSYIQIAALALAVPAAFAQVTVSSPANNATVSSPTTFVASAKSTKAGAAITVIRVYVDNKSALLVRSSSLNNAVAMSTGKHFVVVQAWDSAGAVYKTPLNVTVGTSAPPPPPPPPPGPVVPSNALVQSNIDQMAAWAQCDKCAGRNGNGPATPHTMTENVVSPSLDGKSAEYWLGGTTPYSAALWWKQLGPQATHTHFVYDLWFYIQNPGASQALEFDVNQSVGGKKYIFGTECDYKGSKQWDIWGGPTAHWLHSGIPCTVPTAYTWHHLIWEFQRTSDNKTMFVSMTLDGKTTYLNKSYAPQASGVKELNVAFQMDGNSKEDDYSVWVDKVTLSSW